MTDVIVDEFIVFSDHHGHSFSFGAKEEAHNDQFFVNSRLRAAYEVIREIEQYATEKKVSKVFFGGDLFHVREGVPTIAMNLMFDAIKALASNRTVHMMPGNHDYFDREGKIHSLHTFQTICAIQDWASSRTVQLYGKRKDNVRYSFVPYTDDRNKAIAAIKELSELTTVDEPHILFAHIGMQGAKVGSDYVLVHDNDLSVDDIPWQKFTACLFGHYHEHQRLFQNGWYVGATHQHNWGDANTKRGFLHVKVHMDHVSFDFVETSAPRFIVLKDSESNPEIRPQDFVRILTNKKRTPKEISELREKSGASNCEVVFLPQETETDAIELSEENLSPVAMLSAWVRANESWISKHLPGTTGDNLASYGKAILVEASGT